MYQLIKRYMEKLTKEDVNNFAISKNIFLSPEELDFTYVFIKKNWEQVIKNPKLLNLDRYQNHFSRENFSKIKKLFIEYSSKYSSFLQ
jgi:hypothetical protein